MSTARRGIDTPRAPFPLLPLRNGALFPGTVITLPVGRERSVALLQSVTPGALIGVVTQKSAEETDPTVEGLHPIGTLARVQHIARVGQHEYRLVLAGQDRFRVTSLVRSDPFWLAEGTPVDETGAESQEATLLARAVLEQVEELGLRSNGPQGTIGATEELPGLVADQVAGALGLNTAREVEVLSALDVPTRLKLVATHLAEAKALAELKNKIDSDVRKGLGQGQREALLREQLRAIKKELGDEKGEDELSTLRDRLDKAGLSEEARSTADRELRRLEGLSPQQAEYNVVRTYLEWIADLPWSARSDAKDDLTAVARKLDEDHYGLEDVKKRILEHMAVLKLSGNQRGTILCLAGPPGVGKTSLGQSIADATGRPFVRIALGGVRDEAEIRGHRRTYVGALPGRIVHALKKVKVKNPVVLLDEIDKLFAGWNGSPEAALLEVLDPEQNKSFTDHYMEIPFDLSEVLFVCTANTLDTLSPPLRDRLEIVDLTGYTVEEKVHIAKSHLIPKQLKAHAITDGSLTITDAAVRAVVRDYTRESGVRQLNREFTRLCRALALEVARATDGKAPSLHIDEGDLVKYLGKVKYFSEIAERTNVPGVATGMAWTPVGGDILFIETTRMPGRAQLEITGQLGDVMKESARAALSYVRSNASTLGVDPAFLATQDLHIHVPAGGIPKDGPSAGVTIFTALTSLLTGRRVRPDTSMTGECTLRGRVLPVGGIKGKVLAAHRAGIKRVILPARNARDLDHVPAEVRAELEFIFAEDMSQVLAAALEPAAVATEPVVTTLPVEPAANTNVRSAA